MTERCRVCRKELVTMAGLGAHLRTIHGIYGGKSGKPRARVPGPVPIRRLRRSTEDGRSGTGSVEVEVVKSAARELCPECGREFSALYLSTHRRRAHDVRSGRWPARSRLDGVEPKFRVVPFMVLEDDSGGIWLAERIR